MIDELKLTGLILREMDFAPTSGQRALIGSIASFCCRPSEHKTLILKGYAGTGKTTVVSALVRTMRILRQSTVLMAPTGRAAKVLGSYAGQSAYSIHRVIYRQKAAGSTEFSLNYNARRNTLFIIDEASMIANAGNDGITFGSGRLLDDLIEYIYSADNCSAIFLGDTAQLLPVGQTSSPALDPISLERYGLTVTEFLLTSVLRQAEQSGILYNATRLRLAIEADPFCPATFSTAFPDIKRVTGETLIDDLETSYNTVGLDSTIILTYSNRRAVQYNRGVRASVLFRDDEISVGDFLIVTRNNYFWSSGYEGLDFIANGDIAEIIRVGKHTGLYGFHFADLTLRLVDYDMEITAKILIDSLYTETQQAVNQLNQRLADAVAEDYADITDRRQFWREMRNNEYYNALQVKFAYAITGHKAQGGGWRHVYVDQGYLPDGTVTREYSQWLYTAFTRTQDKLFLINFMDSFFD